MLSSPPVDAAATDEDISALDGVLFEGCHDYPYSYAVSPATPQWHLETFPYGHNAQAVSAGPLVSGGAATVSCSR